ncbi:MAG: hypothetical protein D6793_07200 [Thermoflexia bacterium]|nr:MAG: hypothetical protein D6793_07200 [Thermoflexia bacterium]
MPIVEPVRDQRMLKEFVRFPWRVYRNDPNWVPPLISDQMKALDPQRGAFFRHGEAQAFLAREGREVVGTVVAFIDHRANEYLGKAVGGFGFFEVVEDFSVAAALLDAACQWLREHGVSVLRGPMNFSQSDHGGVLIAGADCPPVMLQSHTPPYYATFLEQYGMEKHADFYAYRIFRHQIGENLEYVPPEILHVAEAAQRVSRVSLRQINLREWDREVRIIWHLFNETLKHFPDYVPMAEEEFTAMANSLRAVIDPEMALVAEIDGEPVGFGVAIPDINRVLIHLNGRLFPLNWLRLRSLMRRIDVASFKLMGVLDRYRMRGIDALLYLGVIRGFVKRGYAWLDGSVTGEYNLMTNLVAQRWGAERYKQFRVYQKPL